MSGERQPDKRQLLLVTVCRLCMSIVKARIELQVQVK